MWLWIWLIGNLQAAPPSPEPLATAASTPMRAMRAVIEGQIDAFRRHDALGAWQYVSPTLQRKFGDADAFLQMVREHYRPVYAPRSYEFGSIYRVDDGWGQWLQVVGPDGKRVRALYLLERLEDGSWRTQGCLIFPPGDEEPPQA